MLVIDLPRFLAATCSIPFDLVAKELRPKLVAHFYLYIPFVMAIGHRISVRKLSAVMEAIIGRKASFARTPNTKSKVRQDSFATKRIEQAGGCPTQNCTGDLLLLSRAVRF